MKKWTIWVLMFAVLGSCAFFIPRIFEDGIAIGNQATTITMDGSGNMKFADAVSGNLLLSELEGGGGGETSDSIINLMIWQDSVTTVLKDTIVYGSDTVTQWAWVLWDSAQTVIDKKIGLFFWKGPDTLYITEVRAITPVSGANIEYQIYHATDITGTESTLFTGAVQIYGTNSADIGETHTPDNPIIPPGRWIWFEWIVITNDAVAGVSIIPVGYVY